MRRNPDVHFVLVFHHSFHAFERLVVVEFLGADEIPVVGDGLAAVNDLVADEFLVAVENPVARNGPAAADDL